MSPVWRRRPAPGHGGGPRFDPDANPPPYLSLSSPCRRLVLMNVANDSGQGRLLEAALPRRARAGRAEEDSRHASPAAPHVGTTLRSVGVGKSSQTVHHQSWAGPIFQSCPRASGAVQRLGYKLGYSRGAAALIPDRLLFRPDISPVGADRASVMRCRRSLLVAVRCCCCCHRCCQPLVLFPVSGVSRLMTA